jgi:hypothetical protein
MLGFNDLATCIMRMTDITWQLNYPPDMTNYSNENIFAKFHLTNHHKSLKLFFFVDWAFLQPICATIVTLCFTHDFLLRIFITQIWLLLPYMWMHFQFSTTCDEISNYPKNIIKINVLAQHVSLLETHSYFRPSMEFSYFYFEHSHWGITL